MKTPVMDIEETKRNNIKVFFYLQRLWYFSQILKKKKKERGGGEVWGTEMWQREGEMNQ